MNTEFLSQNYVNPVYGDLMSTQIAKKQTDEQNAFKQKFTEILAVSTNAVIKELLYDLNWRSSLTASWFIFAKNNIEFTTDIGKLLLQGKAGTIGYCFALAKFGTPECSKFLTDYLEKELQFDKLPTERFQDTALYALMYIDQKNNTNISNQFLDSNGLWTKFIDFDYSYKLKNSQRWGDLETNYKDFVNMFDFMNGIIKETKQEEN